MDPDGIPTIPMFDPDAGPDPDEASLCDRRECREHGPFEAGHQDTGGCDHRYHCCEHHYSECSEDFDCTKLGELR